MDPASHTGFIVAAYAAGFAVVGGLTAWVMADYRAQLRSLADLERKGVTRGSEPAMRQAREDA
jgi:heme exporter protein CcmD